MGACAVAIWMLTAMPLAAAQQVQPERVGGKVVSARDGRPVAHASLTLFDESSHTAVATVRSAEDGGFRFDPVPAGKYDLSAHASGYLGSSYLQQDGFYADVVTGKGLATGSLVMQLTPAASISGRVADEDGEPVQQGQVRLYRENPESAEGITRLQVQPVDEEGFYDFENLRPGRYFVVASAVPWYAVHPMPEGRSAGLPYRSSVDPSLDVAYPLVFYPNASSSDGASPIDVKGGEEVTADMQMTPQHALSVTVQAPASDVPNGLRQFHPLMLMRTIFGKEDDQAPMQTSMMNGVTTLVGVAPGQYTLEEFSSTGVAMVGSTEIQLTSESMTVPPLAPAELANVKVSLKAAPGMSLPAQVQIGLHNSKAPRLAPNQSSVKGSAEFRDLPAADYELTLFADGKVMKIAELDVDGHAAPDKRLHISGAGEIAVTVTLAGAPVTVEGFARRDGRPAAGAMAVLVPADAGEDREFFRRDETSLDGSFGMNQVAPGKYILVAIEDGWSLRWDDPAVLMPYLLHGVAVEVPAPGASEVHLSEPVIVQSRQ